MATEEERKAGRISPEVLKQKLGELQRRYRRGADRRQATRGRGNKGSLYQRVL